MGLLQKLVSRVKGMFSPVGEERKRRKLEEPQSPRGRRRDFSTIPGEGVENKRAFPKRESLEKVQGLSQRRRSLPEDGGSWGWEVSARREREKESFPAAFEKAAVDGRELSRQIEMESRRYCPNLEEDSW